MKTSLRVCLALACFGATSVLSGCGGGSSFFSLNPSQYAGNYGGIFSGAVTQGAPGAGQPVTGTFTATADSAGKVTGSLMQSGLGTFPATGTISSSGAIVLTAITRSQTTTLNGTITQGKTYVEVSGAFTTTRGTATIATGTFTGTRAVQDPPGNYQPV